MGTPFGSCWPSTRQQLHTTPPLSCSKLHSEGPAKTAYGMAIRCTRSPTAKQATTKCSDRLSCCIECSPRGWGSVSWLALTIIERMPGLRYQAPQTTSPNFPILGYPPTSKDHACRSVHPACGVYGGCRRHRRLDWTGAFPSLLQRLAQSGSRSSCVPRPGSGRVSLCPLALPSMGPSWPWSR